MEQIIHFLNLYYEKAQKLSNAFRVTRQKDWNPLILLNELSVQIGHIYNIIYQTNEVNEKNRVFSNLGDELSDVLLQLIALADSMHINLYSIDGLGEIKESHWYSLPILFGQLNEAVMEKYGYRFTKSRYGFNTIEEFIENRIFKLFVITYNIFEKYGLDISREFSLMLSDANQFLEKFFLDSKPVEYIDTYTEKHDFIGVFDRCKAHSLGLWHDVVGCIIFNPCTHCLFLQLKSHKHEQTSSKDLLEITVGGYLKAGEGVEDSIREIKEEAGIDVTFDKMIPCYFRKCDMDRSLIIREFQYYYLLPLMVDLNSFHINDSEVVGFVRLSIEDVFSILQKNTSVLVKIKLKNSIQLMEVTKEDFDSAFIENGLFITLFSKVKEYLEQDITFDSEEQKVLSKELL